MGYGANYNKRSYFVIVEPVYHDIEAEQAKINAAKPGTKLPPAAVTAIVLYVVAMVVGSIFRDRIYIYIAATLVLVCYLGKMWLDKRKKK